MDEEELARLQELIDQHEAATGERSPLRDILEAQESGQEPTTPPEQLQALLETLPAVEPAPEGVPTPNVPEPTVPPELQAPAAPREFGPHITEPGQPPIEPATQPQVPLPSIPEPPPPITEPEPLPQPQATLGGNMAEAVALGPYAAYKSVQPLRNLATKGLGAIARMPWEVAAQVAAVPTMLNDLLGDKRAEEMAQSVAWLKQQGISAEEAIPALALVAKPESPVEKGAAYAGEVIGGATLGGKKFAAPLAATTFGVNALMDLLKGTPGEQLPGVPPLPPFEFTTPAEAAIAPKSVVRKAERELPPGLTPTAKRIVLETAGGPQAFTQSDLRMMGVLGATTLGMAFLPTVFGALKFNKIPKLRSVRDAAEGTVAISTPVDLMRTMDDVTAGPMRILARAGAEPAVLDFVEQNFRIQSRAGARALADSIVQTGKMETPTFRFNAPTSLIDLQRGATPATNQYLLLRDTWDELNRLSQTSEFKPTAANPNPGPPVVSGLTMADINPMIRALEQSNPEVIPYAKQYYAHVREMRDLLSEGEYAILPEKSPATKDPGIEYRSKEYLNSQRPNEVPFRGKRDRGIPLDEREAPISAQAYKTRDLTKDRLQNDVVGTFVDAANRAFAKKFGTQENLFTRITPEELAQNPRWEKNTVSFYRRGQKEYYTTDPFLANVLTMDPYQITGMFGQGMFATKRLLEFGATGMGAPAFSFISMLRSWQIAKFTTEQGFRSPSLVGSLSAIPKQLYPQMAKVFSHWLDEGSGRVLSKVFPENLLNGLARRAAAEFDNSLYAQLKTVGTAKGSILEQQQTQAALVNAANQYMKEHATVAGRAFWNAWRSTFEAVHNGPAFDFVVKNLRAEPLPRLASRARALTGDPRQGGQYYFLGGDNRFHAIRFQPDSGVTHTAAAALARGYGIGIELMRDSVPWFNATLQGAKRIGQAYLDNPIKFTQRMWMYAMAPAAAEYLYARSLGDDPYGIPYVDHLINRRSSYNRQMNWYFPIPGRPASEGVELPFFHEMAPFKRAMEIALDHMFRSNINTLNNDLHNAAWAFLDTAVIPPMPPVVSLATAAGGFTPPQGVFGGEAYKRKDDPFDQTGGLPNSIELMVRAVGGGIGQTLGQTYAAFAQTPEGFTEGLKNAARAALRVQVQRTPGLRDITGVLPTMTGNTDLTKELFDKQKEIDRLNKFFAKWTVGGKSYGPGEINVEPSSKGGGQVTDYLLGPGFTPQSPGLAQPEPTNPLYNMFMEQVYQRFRKESPLPDRKGEDQGGIGFKSLWARYGDATEKLRRLQNVNEGNYVTWQAELAKNPDAKKEIEDYGADPNNIRQVRNFYEAKRHEAARVILYMIKAVERDFSQQLGQPVTLGMIDPYGRGLIRKYETAPFIFPDLQTGYFPTPQGR